MDKFENSLLELISIAGKYQYLPKYLEGCGKFSSSEISILKIIAEYNEIKMTEISKIMVTTKSASTQIVDKLFKKGYVTRITGVDDRRNIIIKLTDKGEEAYKVCTICKSSIIENICEKFVLEEKEYPAIIIRKLIEGLKSNLKKEKNYALD